MSGESSNGNDHGNGSYVAGIVGGMLACGAVIGVVLGVAVHYDNKRRHGLSARKMPLRDHVVDDL
jgi:hypothetical protein